MTAWVFVPRGPLEWIGFALGALVVLIVYEYTR